MRSTESCCNNICCKQVVVCSINSGNSLSTSSMNTRVHTTLNYKSTSAQINFTSHRRQRQIRRCQRLHLIHRTQIQAILIFYSKKKIGDSGTLIQDREPKTVIITIKPPNLQHPTPTNKPSRISPIW